MALWNRKERVALALGAERARLLVARGNGRVKAVHEALEDLPAGAVRPGLKGANVIDRGAVAEAVRTLVADARGAGHLQRKPEIVAIVLADSAVRLAASPMHGDAPGRVEGERMARWSLRELLPAEEDTRVDWSVASSADAGAPASGGTGAAGVGAGSGYGDEELEADRWLVALGTQASVVAEYESLVQEVGWTTGRVVPWTMALSVAVERLLHAAPDGDDSGARQRLLVCEQDGHLACLLESSAIPRFHRAWRGRVETESLAQELEAVERYINDRLEMTVGEAWLCGSTEWLRAATRVAEDLGWRHRDVAPARALLGALRG